MQCGFNFFRNMIQAGKEVAKLAIESQLTHCLQAHIARAAQLKYLFNTYKRFET
jgi:hypothetical protein